MNEHNQKWLCNHCRLDSPKRRGIKVATRPLLRVSRAGRNHSGRLVSFCVGEGYFGLKRCAVRAWCADVAFKPHAARSSYPDHFTHTSLGAPPPPFALLPTPPPPLFALQPNKGLSCIADSRHLCSGSDVTRGPPCDSRSSEYGGA